MYNFNKQNDHTMIVIKRNDHIQSTHPTANFYIANNTIKRIINVGQIMIYEKNLN
jgi:hypothetical protein